MRAICCNARSPLAWFPPAQASLLPTEVVAPLADADMSLAVGASGAIVALSALLLGTDPQKRREQQLAETGGNEKASGACSDHSKRDGVPAVPPPSTCSAPAGGRPQVL